MIPATFHPEPRRQFQRLVQDDTEVSPETGSKPRSSFRAPSAPTVLGMRLQVGRIIDAVNATVPESMWGEIAARLDDAELVQPSREPPDL